VAIGADACEAYLKALACDPVSAYGGVIALNRPVSRELAEELHKNFVEVLSAPGFEHGALAVLQQKESIRILEEEERRQADPGERDVKRVHGGLLIQDRDGDPEPREIMEVVTETQPSEEQWDDLLFAWTVCRRVRSNAIVIAKDGATLGIGAGQMSRVDSVRLAVEKCRDARGEEAEGLLFGSALTAFLAVPDGLLAVRASAYLIAAGAFLAGVGNMIFNSLWETTLQRHVPRAALSRVSAYDWFGSLAFQPIGLAIAGPLAAGIGTSETLWLAAAGSAGIAAILVATPSVRAVTA